ncbi:hypothetical protein D3C76_507910 [compost metagenome]
MSRYRKGCLYIRRMKAGDKADSFITAVQMAATQLICEKRGRRQPMVLVRHGAPNNVIDVDYSRRDLIGRLCSRHRNFKELSRAWRDRPDEQPLPEGLFERNGKVMATCCMCGNDYELLCAPGEFKESMNYCGSGRGAAREPSHHLPRHSTPRQKMRLPALPGARCSQREPR